MKILFIIILLSLTICIYAQNNTRWIDCKNVYINGKAFPDTENNFSRVRDKDLKLLLTADGAYNRATNPAGLHIDFKTNSNNIHVKWSLDQLRVEGYTNINTQGGLDLYMWDKNYWKFLGNASPFYPNLDNQIQIVDENYFTLYKNQEHLYSLNLPTHENVTALEIGIDEGASFEVVKNVEKPIIIYGTSITHGACASRPGLNWPAQVRYRTGENVINWGFGGSGRLEKVATDIICQTDPKIMVLEPFANMPTEFAKERLIYFYTKFREGHPVTPIVFIEQQPISHITTTQKEPIEKNIIMRELFKEWSISDKNIYKIKSEDTYSDQYTSDTIHPNDIGMSIMADNFIKVYKKIIK